jgi:hypothetical protein
MIGTKRVRWIILLLCLAALFLVTEVILPTLAPAQEEVASYIRRYKDRTAAKVRTRTRLADSHWGIRFYQRRRCEDCHIRETRDIHTTRANITCRQCHGGEPIASLGHYYSPFNPIRKHAYVCAKCHEGANASYASYLVHTPNPALAATQKTFPLLFYVFWFMIVLAGGTSS